MNQTEFEIVSIIAKRKTEFYLKTKQKLLETLPALIDRKEAIRRVRHAISKIDNSLFISQDEKATKIINPELSVDQLKLDQEKIIEIITKAVTVTS